MPLSDSRKHVTLSQPPEKVEKIIDDVRLNKDKALIYYEKKFTMKNKISILTFGESELETEKN